VSGLICTIFTAIGAAAQILEVDEWKTYIIIAAALFVSVSLVTALIFKTHAEFGLRKPEHIEVRTALFCLPLLIMEVLPIMICGFRTEMRLAEYSALALFTIFVSLNEEIWFRGIALKAMSVKGSRRAIIATSVIFGALHSASLLGNADAAIGGAGLASTLLQIVFAFGTGIALASILVLTKSLLIPIVWHMAHDFVAISTNTRGLFGDSSEVITTALQVVLLITSVAGLWGSATKSEKLPAGKGI